jgi:hypothetical protein
MKRESTITASQRPFRKLSWMKRIHAVTTWWGKFFKQTVKHTTLLTLSQAYTALHIYTHKLGQDARKETSPHVKKEMVHFNISQQTNLDSSSKLSSTLLYRRFLKRTQPHIYPQAWTRCKK